MSALPADLLAGIPDASALRRLFAALGYSLQERTEYSARTLEWPANVAVDLRGRAFELLADADDGYFQVLLLPPHPETRGLSQELVRRLYTTLEQRVNEAILVLPDQGWGALELVLLADLRPLNQRAAPPSTFLRFSFDSRALRPHQQIALGLLDATGAGPGEPAERAARAFRRAQQERFFRSVNFFSTYYLERRIASDAPVQDRWAALSSDMPALRAALAGAATPAALAALGWQVGDPAAPGAPSRLAAAGVEVALLSVLPADHPLDQALSDASYPQLELIAALEKQKQADGVRWAVLTNGRQWRLYSPIAASISGAFYEVDLGDLLAFGADDDLRYFAAFFGAAGLATGLARTVFTSSQTLAKEVGESLKKVVFDHVFALLANAISEDLTRRGEYTGDDAQMELIRRATLVLLYRVLFLLYAESMRLLPTLHRDYYPHSLTFLLSEIAVHSFTPAHLQKPMGPTAFWAWDHLRDLCAAVSGGRAAWGVPKYNGGLFSDGAAVSGQESPHRAPHRLLARAQLGAMDLCKALRLLGLDPAALAATTPEEARHLIDYAGLDVRRLGSIYEGLLEYRLAEAADGALELRHSREDRKASGSYYTPDYIVAYIVEQAVGPVLEERGQRFAALMERLPAARRELERATRAEGSDRVSIATAKANSDAARTALAAMEHEAVESLLDLKILDPAMGSGHFLVEAVNFVTDRLIGILDRHKEGNPLLARLDGIRQQIRASLRDQGIDAQLIGDAQLNNVNLLRRLVMKRCVFGVDLNDMAVELARLSLWLTSFTVGAPLNFLDHHLKWGNSLIGARVQAVQQAMEGKNIGVGTQIDMFTSGSAFKEMLDLAGFIEELVEIADANAQQVEQSEALYRAYEQSVVPVKRLLDLWVSRSFGSKEANELITLYSGGADDVLRLKAALAGSASLAHPPHQRALDRARELFEQHRFLHWDLDFPEVFLDLRKKAWKPADEMGFDAVVGNPPYDILSEKERDESLVSLITYFEIDNELKAALGRKLDLFRLFVAKSTFLARRLGNISMIVPMSLLADQQTKSLRKHILASLSLLRINAFPQKDDGERRVFREAKLPTCIFVAQNANRIDKKFSVITHPGRLLEEVAGIYNCSYEEIIAFDNDSLMIPLLRSNVELKLSLKLFEEGGDRIVSMSKLVHTYQGEINETNMDRLLTTNPATGPKVLRGGNIDRYAFVSEAKQGVDKYIDVRKYETQVKGDKSSHVKMFRIGYQRNAALDNWRRLIFAPLPTPSYCFDSVSYYIASDKIKSFALLALLNSQLLEWSFRLTSSNNHVSTSEIDRLPAPNWKFTTPEAQRAALVAEAQALYEGGPRRGVETPAPGPAAGRPPVRSGAGEPAKAEGDPATGAEHWRGWREGWAGLWAWADARLPRLADGSPDTAGEQSDAVHDLLAFLAERMIALHKQKQVGAAAFTGWLEGETGSQIEEWTLKTVINSFWAQPWEEIERAIQKNRGKLVQSAGLRGKAADAALLPLLRVARGRWSTASAELAPTLAAISATDRLIDLLVYRLYGLSDEEIDLVEGG